MAAKPRDAHLAAQAELEACETRLRLCEEAAKKKKEAAVRNDSLEGDASWSSFRTPDEVYYSRQKLNLFIFEVSFLTINRGVLIKFN